MKHIRLYSAAYLEIEYNLLDDILIGNWYGPQTNESIKNGYEQLSDLLKKQVCRKLLDNHLEVEGIWAELAGWMAYDWHPRAEGMGLEYHACVFSKNTFSRLSTEQAVKMVKTGIVKGFDTVSAAETWLKNF